MNRRRGKKKGTKRRKAKSDTGRGIHRKKRKKERKVSNLQLPPSMLQNLLSVSIAARISAKPESKIKSMEKLTTVITTSGTGKSSKRQK